MTAPHLSGRGPAGPRPDHTPSPLLTLLARGVAAGGVGGLLSGLFSLLLTRPLMNRAIELEEERGAVDHAHDAGAHGHAHEELFGRGAQHLGLVVTAVVAGLAIGVFFALAYSLIHRAGALEAGRDHWNRALLLAGAGFLSLSLLPGLRYPAAPPGVGDGDTVAERQLLWLAAMLVAALGTIAARQLYLRTADRERPVRQIVVAVTLVATLGALFLLPGNPDELPVPADLLWEFRVFSIAAHALLWAGLGAAFGLLGLRWERHRAARGPGTARVAAATADDRDGARTG